MAETLSNEQKDWSVIKKLFMLFMLSYFFIYMFPFPADYLPVIKNGTGFYSKAIDSLNIWFGRSILKITFEKNEFTGSGDTTFDYVKLATASALSLIITLLVFAFTFHKKNYSKLYFWVMTYARYFLCMYMIIYGVGKVIERGQFGYPNLVQLEQTYGNSTPMGLLWTFMGYSRAYASFGGILELTCGLLLLFRRTMVLGALITIAVMLNIVMMNFCFDVCVKISSFHLLMIAFILIAPDIKRLIDFFVLRKATVLPSPKFELQKRWMRIARIIFKSLIIAYIPVVIVINSMAIDNSIDPTYSTILNGVYTTENFTRNQIVLPPLETDAFRWKKLLIEDGSARIITMTNSTSFYQVKTDTIHKKITLIPSGNSDDTFSFSYENQSGNYFSLKGIYMSDTISANFKKKTIRDYTLTGRGFHWINEYPYQKWD